jgi:hypothetical protein
MLRIVVVIFGYELVGIATFRGDGSIMKCRGRMSHRGCKNGIRKQSDRGP